MTFNRNNKYAIAIDGPSGAGKSTIAKMLAQRLGFIYVDTGAMYRAAALYFLQNKIDIDNCSYVIQNLDNLNISIKYENGQQRIFLNSTDVSDELRTPPVSEGASKVAVYNQVREKLVELQREIAQNENVVMDGRDIATHVLPKAQLKIYLDASAMERTIRRLKELQNKRINKEFDVLLKEIEERDFRDMNREFSPLKKANDALVIDSSDLSCEEVVCIIETEFNKIR